MAFSLATIGTAAAQSARHAYLWDSTTGLRDLGSLGGDSSAVAINDTGTVVGYYLPTDGRTSYHGFIWTEATGMVDIGVPGGGDSSTAEVMCTGINAAGNVVGYGRQVDGQQVAFFWSPTNGFTTFGSISTDAENGNAADSINDLDQVTGNIVTYSQKREIILHACFWTPGMAQARDLGVVEGAQDSTGFGINNRAKIVGTSFADNLAEPMSWTKKLGMTLIGMIPGTLSAQAQAINDAGEIIGLDETGTNALGFYTASGTGLKFLKGLGGVSSVPLAINQNGLIVGYADDTTKTTHAVMWPTFSSKPIVIVGADHANGVNNLGQVVGSAYFQ